MLTPREWISASNWLLIGLDYTAIKESLQNLAQAEPLSAAANSVQEAQVESVCHHRDKTIGPSGAAVIKSN